MLNNALSGMRRNLSRFVAYWPVFIAASLAMSYGAASAAFALIALVGLLSIYPYLSPQDSLYLVDVFIGSIALVAGFSITVHREWARRMLAEGAIAISLYELARRFTVSEWSQVSSSFVIVIVALMLVRFLANSKRAVRYVETDSGQ